MDRVITKFERDSLGRVDTIKVKTPTWKPGETVVDVWNSYHSNEQGTRITVKAGLAVENWGRVRYFAPDGAIYSGDYGQIQRLTDRNGWPFYRIDPLYCHVRKLLEWLES